MCVRERKGERKSQVAAGCIPTLVVSVVTSFSLLPPRPLASTVNDKLELQECLEHGRIAKVRPSVRALCWGAGRGQRAGGARTAPRAVTLLPPGALWEQLPWRRPFRRWHRFMHPVGQRGGSKGKPGGQGGRQEIRADVQPFLLGCCLLSCGRQTLGSLAKVPGSAGAYRYFGWDLMYEASEQSIRL